jgi:phage terminase large subunit-like protein
LINNNDLSQFTEDDIKALNDFSGYLEFVPTKVWYWLINCPCKIIALFTGNQFGKGETVVMDYYLRVWGKHPIKHKNVLPDDKIRTFRWASETLPGESENEDITNTQYPVMKRRFNPSWLIKDITAREKVVRFQPQTLRTLSNGEKCMTKPCAFEYVSFQQTTQRGAGFQRRSTWIDESAPMDFFGEQIPRLLAADGDLIVSYTPTPGKMGWEFDYFYERAKVIYRTEHVRNRMKVRFGEDLPEIEHKDSKHDIAVIMAATDDNPIYERLAAEKSKRVGRVVTVDEYISDSLGLIADEDEVDARRYGLFRQMSGNIFKVYNEKIHRISEDKWFPEGIPHDWKHFRGIDWHESTPWAIGWVAVSPNDEIFVYNEFNPSPEKMVTMDIMRIVAERSKDYRFDLSLIDPLSSKIQPNTGLSSLEDINRLSSEYKRLGIGTGGYWQVWDTKSQKGRDEIKKRLQNATLCGVPFSNEVKKDGITKRLPTLWILDNCTQTHLSLKNWRLEEWGDRTSLITKDSKETPQQRWSHFCTMLEGLMKRPEVFAAKFHVKQDYRPPKEYFKGAA